MIPNFELYYKVIRSELFDIFYPIIIEIVNDWYKDGTNDADRIRRIVHDAALRVKNNKQSVFIAHVGNSISEKDIRIFQELQFEYVKYYSAGNRTTQMKITKEDLFISIYITVARCIYKCADLLIDSNDMSENQRKREQANKLIKKCIKKGIDRCLLLSFLNKQIDEEINDKELNQEVIDAFKKKKATDRISLKKRFLGHHK